MDKYPQHTYVCILLSYLNVGGGSECTVAAGVAENLSEGEDDHKHLSLSPQKMANKKLVRLERSSVEMTC